MTEIDLHIQYKRDTGNCYYNNYDPEWSDDLDEFVILSKDLMNDYSELLGDPKIETKEYIKWLENKLLNEILKS